MMDFMKPTPLDLEAEDRLRAAIDAGEIGPDAELWRFFARHTATTRAELAALQEALGALITEMDGLNYVCNQSDGPAIIAARAALTERPQ